MAFDPTVLTLQPFIGTPVPRDTFLDRAHSLPPKSVSTYIDWSLYGAAQGSSIAISVNLLLGATVNPLDSIRSVYVDNSFSDVDVYVYFQDTRYMVIAPANSVIIQPVITGLQEAIIFAENFGEVVPKTTVIFTNVQMEPYKVDVSFAGLPPQLIYEGDIAGAPTSNGTVKTFNLVPLGPGAQKRIIIIAMSFVGNFGFSANLTSVTLNGVPMTIVNTQPAIGSSSVAGNGSAIAYVSNLGDLQGTIVAMFNGNISVSRISAYQLTQMADNDPIDSGGVRAGAGTNASLSFDLGLPKYAVGLWNGSNVNTTSPTMAGIVVDSVIAMTSGFYHIAGHYQAPLDTIKTVTSTLNTLVGSIWN